MCLTYISSGIAILAGQPNFRRIVDDLNKSPALRFIAGSSGIMIGTICVTSHNHWVRDWTILITLICWGLLIGGIIVVIIPKSLLWMSTFHKHSPAWGILMIAFGLLFDYSGFLK